MRHIQEIDMNELIVANVNKYAKMLAEKKYLQSGYIAVREEDGIVITNPRIDYTDVKEENLTFVNDKNIETLEGNFRAAAVILFCAIRQDKEANAAAIVDSDSTVEFSKKRKTLMPILDDMNDAKTAQRQNESKIAAAWRDYFTLLFIILLAPLLIRFVQPQWYYYLVRTLIGKVLSIALLGSLVWATGRALKINQPITG